MTKALLALSALVFSELLISIPISRAATLQDPPQAVVSPGDSTSTFATKLLQAQTEREREMLLTQNRELVTPELTQLFLDQGRDYFIQGNMPQTVISLQIAKIIAEKRGDKLRLAQVLTTLGNVNRMQGKDAIALLHLRQALTLHEALGNKQGVFFSLLSIVIIDISANNYDERNLQRLLVLAQESKSDYWIALSKSQLGSMQFLQGNYSLALESHQGSLKLYQRSGATEGEAFALHAIGIIQRVYGNYELALDYFHKSIELTEVLRRKDLAPRTLSSIGAVYELLGNHDKALEYHQKSIAAGESAGSKFWTIFSLNSMGEIYRSQGQLSQALVHLDMALKLSEELGYKDAIAYVCLSIGDIKYLEGDYFRALELAERALAIARQTGSRDILWKALTAAGKAHSALNQKEKARRVLEEATNTVESLRSSIVGQEFRSGYFATVQQPYQVYIDVLMQLHKQDPGNGNDVLALQVHERALARSLMETLTEAHADIRKGVDASLLQRERTLQQQLNATAARAMRLKITDEEVAATKKQIDSLTSDYQQVQAQIRQSSPRYAALTQPKPLTVQQIQTEVLDADTALLEYSLGDERSYLWLVTSTSVKSFELPGRARMEASVRNVAKLLSNGERWTTDSRVTSEYEAEATKLSRTLLPPTLISQLRATRLLIVGDGALNYLPFGALPIMQNQESGASRAARKSKVSRGSKDLQVQISDALRPLIASYEVVSLPSASTLAVLRRENLNRSSGAKSIAIMADPVFDETDERVTKNKSVVGIAGEETRSQKQTLSSSLRVLQRALASAGATMGQYERESLRIKRLPFTRLEAEGVLAAALQHQTLKATDFRANRETATSAELAQYRFVHFATHAILNSEHPELSGIVLSLVDEQGKPVDGFLRLHDIYNLNLPADLVVLSACQTALGKEIRGEGLVGLTRGFMYAGSPRVVASLWKVDDAATAELMKRFYSALLKDNLRPAAALRRAKVEMWKQKRWQAPFYWAAFELQGEWK